MPKASPEILQLGPFQLLVEKRVLLREGQQVDLAPRAVEVLTVLAIHAGEIVGKDDLMGAIWPDTFVEEGNLPVYISALRKLLAGAGGAIQIETIPRRGYRLLGLVHTTLASSIPTSVVESDSFAPDSPGKAPYAPLPPKVSGFRHFAAGNARRIGILLFLCLAVVVGTLSLQRAHRPVTSAPSATLVQASSDALPAAAPSSVPEAEDLYLKGRYSWSKRSPEGLRKAVDYFTQAIVKDPNYAAPYIGLADCYNLLREYTLMPPEEAYPRALAAAQRAVALDDSSVEAHASLAFVTYYWLWNADAAEREFKRAIQLNPGYATAHHWYAVFLMSLGRFPEALAQINKAQELDSNSAAILADKGVILWNSGKPNEALQLLKQVEETEPGFLSPHTYLSRFYLQMGDNAGYLAESRMVAVALNDQHALEVVKAGEKGLARGGTRGMLENILQVQQQLYQQDLISAYSLATTESLLGHDTEAFRYLQAAIQKRESEVLFIQMEPLMKKVRANPAYPALLKQIGLPQVPLPQPTASNHILPAPPPAHFAGFVSSGSGAPGAPLRAYSHVSHHRIVTPPQQPNPEDIQLITL
jgi:DNA-binding winged helix-turn-helix (wHTH) protein/tetratricopeptide (TPR) repeat protein